MSNTLYLPTADEIARQCERIQSGWSPRTRRSRQISRLTNDERQDQTIKAYMIIQTSDGLIVEAAESPGEAT